MLVLQQLKVLPAGSRFLICDMGTCKIIGKISESDKSLAFETAKHADTYYNVYSTFKVAQLNAIDNGFGMTFIIEVRG